MRAFCCPVPSARGVSILVRRKDDELSRYALSLSLAVQIRSFHHAIVLVGIYSALPDNGGTIPNEPWIFTTSVEAMSPPSLVEVPGPAPGSKSLIPSNIYRRSQPEPTLHYNKIQKEKTRVSKKNYSK